MLKRLWLSAFFVLLFFAVGAKEEPQITRSVVSDLSDQWLVFDEATSAYIPWVDRRFSRASVHLRFDPRAYASYDLSFPADKDLCVFIDNALFLKVDKTQLIDISVDKLAEKGSAPLLITFFHPRKILPLEEIGVYKLTRSYAENTGHGSDLGGLSRMSSNKKNMLIISIMVLISTLAVLRYRGSPLLNAYYSVVQWWSGVTEDYIVLNSFSLESIALVFIAALSSAIVLLTNNYVLIDLQFLGIDVAHDEAHRYVLLFINLLSVFILLLAKYYFLVVVSRLVGLKNFARVHYYEFTRMVSIASLALLLASMFTVFGTGDGNNVLKVTFVAICLVWLIKMGQVLSRASDFPKLYFFSYLCTTEIIPLMVLLKQVESY